VCDGATKDALRTAVFNFYRVAKVAKDDNTPITEPEFYEHIAKAINCFLKGDDKVSKTDTRDIFITPQKDESTDERPNVKHHTPWGNVGGDDEEAN
jgi:hypothetical protein